MKHLQRFAGILTAFCLMIILFFTSCAKNINKTVTANINNNVNGLDMSKINILNPSNFLLFL